MLNEDTTTEDQNSEELEIENAGYLQKFISGFRRWQQENPVKAVQLDSYIKLIAFILLTHICLRFFENILITIVNSLI